MNSSSEISENELNEILGGVNSLLSKSRQYYAGRLKVESIIVNSEKELEDEIKKEISDCSDLESWCMFSDRIVRNCNVFDKESLLKLQEAELYSRTRQRTVRVKRLAAEKFAFAVYLKDAGDGDVMPYQIQSVCVRQDIVSRDKMPKKVNYALWYRKSSDEKGKIVPYLQQFIGYKEV
jgi:hypothetical protein